jgi:branched-subunit amino acid transport protein
VAESLLALILGMALVTYLPRLLPLWLLSSRRLPPLLIRWLELIPPAVLAALLAPGLLLDKENGAYFLHLGLDNTFLAAAFPTMLAAWFTRSFFGAVAAGMVSVALLRQFSG